MIDIIIAMKRTSGLNIAKYRAYRKGWEKDQPSLQAGRKGGSGDMECRLNCDAPPGLYPMNVLWEEELPDD